MDDDGADQRTQIGEIASGLVGWFGRCCAHGWSSDEQLLAFRADETLRPMRQQIWRACAQAAGVAALEPAGLSELTDRLYGVVERFVAEDRC